MSSKIARRTIQGLAALLLVAAVSACATRLPIKVHDVDTYHQVHIGSVSYTLGDGYPVIEKGRTMVAHAVEAVPGARLEIEVDPNPPRDFRFDADAEKRKFLRALPNANLTSAQYNEVTDWVRVRSEGTELPQGEESFEQKTQYRVKINTRARANDGSEMVGVLVVLREMDRTATVRLVGNREDAHTLNRLADKVADEIHWVDSRRQPRTL